jgi:hypothetical protein
MLTRRRLLAGTAAAGLIRPAIAFPAVGSGIDQRPPASFSIGTIYRYNDGYSAKYVGGDGYFPTWADDGFLYGIMDDSYGVSYTPPTSNFEIIKMDGFTSALTVTSVNKMAAFGTLGQMSTAASVVDYNYKASAILCVGGTLYCNVGMFKYVNGPGINPWLPALQAQIIKSTNKGGTWTPLPVAGTAEAYTTPAPMFPNMYAGGYIQYGQNYTGTGPHNSGAYVYCFFPSNTTGRVGLTVTLGRVTIANLPNLVGSDWSFYQGGDGMSSGAWGAYATSVPVFGEAEPPGQCPRLWWVNGQYLPAFGCYVITPSFWTAVSPSLASTPTVIQVWKAYAPWGPWTQVGADYNTGAGGFYGVAMCPSSVATDGGRNTVLMAGGDFANNSSYTSNYNLHLIPLTLS